MLPLADNWPLTLDDSWIDLCWQMAALVKGWDRDAGLCWWTAGLGFSAGGWVTVHDKINKQNGLTATDNSQLALDNGRCWRTSYYNQQKKEDRLTSGDWSPYGASQCLRHLLIPYAVRLPADFVPVPKWQWLGEVHHSCLAVISNKTSKNSNFVCGNYWNNVPTNPCW